MYCIAANCAYQVAIQCIIIIYNINKVSTTPNLVCHIQPDLIKFIKITFEHKLSSSTEFLYFYIFYRLCYYSCLIFFSPLFPSAPYHPPTIIPPPYVMSVGCTYKFFGFSISPTILNLPLCILYLPFMLLI